MESNEYNSHFSYTPPHKLLFYLVTYKNWHLFSLTQVLYRHHLISHIHPLSAPRSLELASQTPASRLYPPLVPVSPTHTSVSSLFSFSPYWLRSSQLGCSPSHFAQPRGCQKVSPILQPHLRNPVQTGQALPMEGEEESDTGFCWCRWLRGLAGKSASQRTLLAFSIYLF